VTENPALDPGSSLYFRLTIDGEDMGIFNGCEGLAVEVEVEEYAEGGNNGYVTRLPGRLKHSTLRADGSLVTQWGLLDALPSSWTGPTLNPSSTDVATETLEIVFHGFIDAGA
jgi:hypothetical protein